MQDHSTLLEHTLMLSGDIVPPYSVWQGWPGAMVGRDVRPLEDQLRLMSFGSFTYTRLKAEHEMLGRERAYSDPVNELSQKHTDIQQAQAAFIENLRSKPAKGSRPTSPVPRHDTNWSGYRIVTAVVALTLLIVACWKAFEYVHALAPVCDSSCNFYSGCFNMSADVGCFRYYRSSHSVEIHAGSQTAEAAIIVVQGSERSAITGLCTVVKGMGMAGLKKAKVVVVAPNFLILKPGHVLPSKSVRWMGIDEWTRGDDSVGAGEPMSSFDVLDRLIATFADRSRYPALRSVILTGHHTAAEALHAYYTIMVPPPELLRVRFVLLDPHIYTYPNNRRPHAGEVGPCVGLLQHNRPSLEVNQTLFLPMKAKRCPSYNSWRYGLGVGPSESSYVRSAVKSLQKTRPHNLGLWLLLSSNNIQTDANDTCAAKAQGQCPLQRGLLYARSQKDTTTLSIFDNPRSTCLVLQSLEGQRALFDWSSDYEDYSLF